ncbi:hypothetical protein BMS_2204 [Halobacteriovorax marinus SJ]|uniref:DUF2452 domain-containing protein n=2 Tax=Halobacteriovorax marinus TaxID=97084 RepID=E1X3S9_HALMS|nr:hypothetical protein BMS_2204 [Halobacteriovorax marinus SJ]
MIYLEAMKDNKDKLGREIDINSIDRNRLKLNASDLPGLVAYATNASSALINPEDEGKIKSKALRAMHQQTAKQMDQLMEQMQPLIEQAAKLKKRVEVSELIYGAHISFEPMIGETYHLYQKENEEHLLSIIGPDEWGSNMPYKSWVASVELLADHTWEVLD